jgi:hypothetical protein
MLAEVPEVPRVPEVLRVPEVPCSLQFVTGAAPAKPSKIGK